MPLTTEPRPRTTLNLLIYLLLNVHSWTDYSKYILKKKSSAKLSALAADVLWKLALQMIAARADVQGV